MLRRGRAGASGRAAGRAWLWPPRLGQRERLQAAQDQAEDALHHRQHALRAQGAPPEWLDLITAHRLMLRDPLLIAPTLSRIRAGDSAEQALRASTRDVIASLQSSQSPALAQRSADVEQVRDRLLVALGAQATASPGEQAWRSPALPERPVVLVAADVPPDILLGLRRRLRALCLDRSGSLSHAVSMARQIGVPAVVGLGDLSTRVRDGQALLVDGDLGEVVVDPTSAEVRRLRARRPGRSAQLPDHLMVNLALPEDDLPEATDVGLLRTEALWEASEDEQARRYASLARRLRGRLLTVRLFDPNQTNPLGVRGVRWLAVDPKRIEAQLRAIARAAEHGRVRVLVPMLTHIEQLQTVRERLPDSVPVGAMIETPAAAWQTDRLAIAADFLAVGTSDLTQFLLAADRRDPLLSGLLAADAPILDPVLRHIATRAGPTELYVCGDLASTDDGLQRIVAAGINGVSVAPTRLQALRRPPRSAPSRGWKGWH